ncbi:MAG: alpha-glucan family phosphorylase [Candidatus Bruticola sp.]
MHILGTVVVRPVLPDRIAGLQELSHNLWWSWNPEALALFANLDQELWNRVGHNPVSVLANVDQNKLEDAAKDDSYLKAYDKVIADFKAYMNPKTTRYSEAFPENKDKIIAYFSAEFGMHESLPIYSGGLGILSGDHLKTASDMGIPMIGVGLLYNHGYFIQTINQDGWQEASYKPLDFSMVPAEKALDANGNEIIVQIEMPDRIVSARVWILHVGRIKLYLLDTDIEQNSMADRGLSARLYGGDNQMRIAQEKILGIGGVKALRRLGLDPWVWHMNEGHSAFLTLELMREYVSEKGLTWRQAIEVISPKVCFTTHTPVPAGQDAFGNDLMEMHFWKVRNELGMSRNEFMRLGQNPGHPEAPFNLTIFCLKLAGFSNGVSKLHGKVSRHLWRDVWPEVPAAEIPITSVTNGIHIGTWVAPEISDLYKKYVSKDWQLTPDNHKIWDKAKIPAEEMWHVHQILKQRMIDGVRTRQERRLRRLSAPLFEIESAKKCLSPNVLTIGFARRFATYKRAVLLFSDIERLKKIMFAPGREINFVFAGKAHPADRPGQEFIKRIHDYSKMPEFKGHIILLEDYDIDLARHLVQGVDVWLNNPRRPLEASGTSGEKAAMNGVLNFSVLDGWWAEGFNGKNGWSIGENRPYNNNEEQDFIDMNSLYSTLEEQIVPAYYDNRNKDGVPTVWTSLMLNSVSSLVPEYSTHRMLHDYCHDIYVPAGLNGEIASENDYAKAKDLAEWKQYLEGVWHEVNLEAEAQQRGEMKRSQELSVNARVFLGRLNPQQVKVELYAGKLEKEEIVNPQVVELNYGGYRDGAHCYEGKITPNATGNFAYSVRVIPAHANAKFTDIVNFIRWSR